jgi:ABC-type glutathione transport system ATPase component
VPSAVQPSGSGPSNCGEDEAEALATVNDTMYGLGAGVWTRDGSRAFRSAARSRPGACGPTNYHQYPAGAGFGGYKASGIGRENDRMMLATTPRPRACWSATTPSRWGSSRPVGDDAAIRAEGLTKNYGNGRGLLALDLEVRRAEVLGFLSPNGAGKSTAMRVLLDLTRPTAGAATLLGIDSRAGALEMRRRVGSLPGDFALYPKLTGGAVLDHLAALRGGVDRRVRDQLVERFDAPLDRPVRELATGNRQKLGLL